MEIWQQLTHLVSQLRRVIRQRINSCHYYCVLHSTKLSGFSCFCLCESRYTVWNSACYFYYIIINMSGGGSSLKRQWVVALQVCNLRGLSGGPAAHRTSNSGSVKVATHDLTDPNCRRKNDGAVVITGLGGSWLREENSNGAISRIYSSLEALSSSLHFCLNIYRASSRCARFQQKFLYGRAWVIVWRAFLREDRRLIWNANGAKID